MKRLTQRHHQTLILISAMKRLLYIKKKIFLLLYAMEKEMEQTEKELDTLKKEYDILLEYEKIFKLRVTVEAWRKRNEKLKRVMGLDDESMEHLHKKMKKE